MKSHEIKKVEDFFQLFLVLFLLFLFVFILWDFIYVLIFASSLVFLTYKPYNWILKVFRSENLSAFMMSALLIVLLIIPLYFVMDNLVDESRTMLNTGIDLYENFDTQSCYSDDICMNVVNFFKYLDIGFDQGISKLSSEISSSYNVIISSIWSLAINSIIFILSYFFLLKDGDKLVRYLRRVVPMKDSYKDALFFKFRDVSSAVFLETIFIAIIQGALTGLGLYFVGFETPIFWSIIASIVALLPFFGASLVWIPAVVYLILTGDYLLAGILSGYGLLVISTIDNILRPVLLKSRVQVHTFIIFLAILGGINVFGFFGIFLGPLIVSMLVTVVQLYRLEFH